MAFVNQKFSLLSKSKNIIIYVSLEQHNFTLRHNLLLKKRALILSFLILIVAGLLQESFNFSTRLAYYIIIKKSHFKPFQYNDF
jgi:hypothetical protein